MLDDLETVNVEFDDGITTVTLNRPEKRNSMNPQLHADMRQTIETLKRDADNPEGGTNVLVLTGAGESFCAGQSLDETFHAHKDDPWGAREVGKDIRTWGKELRYFPRPTIAKVNGWVFGAGVRVLCSTDMAISSDQARYGLSEVNFGIFPSGGSTRVPSYVIGHRDFMYLALSGEDVGAERAREMRLVNKVVPHEDLDEEVRDLAETINELNPLVTQFAKQVYFNVTEDGMSYDTALDYELAKIDQLRKFTESEDMRSIEAFMADEFRPGLESYRPEDE